LFDGTLALEWEEYAGGESAARERFEKRLFAVYRGRSAKEPARWMLVLGTADPGLPLSPSLSFWRGFFGAIIHRIQAAPDCEEKRGRASVELSDEEAGEYLRTMPPMVGVDRADAALLRDIGTRLLGSFRTAIGTFTGTVDEFFASLSPDARAVDRIHFHLVENPRDETRPFAFLATYSTRLDKRGRARHVPLKHAFEEYAGRSDKLLELLGTVHKVAAKNPLVRSMLDSGELFNPVALTPGEALGFLRGVADFEAAGILCRIPRWWKGAPRRAAVGLSLGNRKPSRLGFDALLDFKPGVYLDGEEITEARARRIVERAEGLVLVKGRWVAVDTDSLKQTLEAMKKARTLARGGSISFADAMRMLMGRRPEELDVPELSGAEVSCGKWLSSVLEKMANPKLIRATAPSPALKATLRPYQRDGLCWLRFMRELGFGVCLADDMGLGKTVQVLAHLQLLKGKGRTSLIVAPATLLQNWRNEIERFTPDLTTIVIHPQWLDRASLQTAKRRVGHYDVAITTYGMLSRLSWLTAHRWFYVVCDEAQAIKNPATRQTKTVKRLEADGRCVMTGTPVENRLTDLWSLFDFINPGLLGSFTQFKAFAKKLDANPEGYGQLRRVIHPYILRRAKTDKSIIRDLPDKVEMKTWCTLSRQQTVLYDRLVGRLDTELGRVEGIKRKGLVLGYLMKCKQLCNHPDHYAGDGVYREDESGKFRRLAEVCATIRERREKVLVFTQFAEIIEPLMGYLESIFGAPGQSLSGTTSVAKRAGAVERFQSDDYVPFFVLSLKAGGTGLNLTAANHVIHFDRWWNPAVENQATDRAFRIGQKKNVMVHRFICKGTIEEKIDALIEDKKKLAADVVPAAGESWITELDDADIKDMFRLTLSDGG
jgi:non-specific serine/threonine protein kinase